MSKAKVYVSFAPGDESWADQVRNALTCIAHQERLECWDFRDIVAGEDEDETIGRTINEANLSVLLISMAYLNSDRIKRLDVPRLLGRQEADGLPLIPLLTRPCPWRTVRWVQRRQLLPEHGGALSGGSAHQIDLDLTALAYKVNDMLI